MCVKTVLPCERDLGNFYVPRCGDKPKPYSVQLITWWIITSWVTRIYSAKVFKLLESRLPAILGFLLVHFIIYEHEHPIKIQLPNCVKVTDWLI